VRFGGEGGEFIVFPGVEEESEVEENHCFEVFPLGDEGVQEVLVLVGADEGEDEAVAEWAVGYLRKLVRWEWTSRSRICLFSSAYRGVLLPSNSR
jgi:hypothetical protein